MKTTYKFKVKNGDKIEEFDFMEVTKAVSREGEMVYAKEYAECVRNKLLTNAEALKIANDRGGVFSEDEKDGYVKALASYLNKEKLVSDIKAEDKETEASVALVKSFNEAKQEVLAYQSKQEEIYTFTAESKSRDAVIIHYALAMTYKDGKPYFEGRDYANRMKNMEGFSEQQHEVLKRSIWYATAFFYSIPADSKDVVFPQDRGLVVESDTPKVE